MCVSVVISYREINVCGKPSAQEETRETRERPAHTCRKREALVQTSPERINSAGESDEKLYTHH